MDVWHALVGLSAYVIVMKLYNWCQICYWCSPKCGDTWGNHCNQKSASGRATQIGKENNNDGSSFYYDRASVPMDEPSLREDHREAVAGR